MTVHTRPLPRRAAPCLREPLDVRLVRPISIAFKGSYQFIYTRKTPVDDEGHLVHPFARRYDLINPRRDE